MLPLNRTNILVSFIQKSPRSFSSLLPSASSITFTPRAFSAPPSQLQPLFRTMSSYTSYVVGKPDTPDYKVYLKDSQGNIISSVHDIPLKPAGVTDKKIFNMVVEVPRWTNAKLEVSIF